MSHPNIKTSPKIDFSASAMERSRLFKEISENDLLRSHASRILDFETAILKMPREHLVWCNAFFAAEKNADSSFEKIKNDSAESDRSLVEKKEKEKEDRAQELRDFILSPTETMEMGDGSFKKSRRALYKEFILDRQDKVIKKAGSYFGFAVGSLSAASALVSNLSSGHGEVPGWAVKAVGILTQSSIGIHHPWSTALLTASCIGVAAFIVAKGAANKAVDHVFTGLSVSQAVQLLADDPPLARPSHPLNKPDGAAGDKIQQDIADFEALSQATTPSDRVLLMALNESHSLQGLKLVKAWRDSIQATPDGDGLSLAFALKTARDHNAPPAWVNPELLRIRQFLSEPDFQRSKSDMNRAERVAWLFLKALTTDSLKAQKLNVLLAHPVLSSQKINEWRAKNPEDRGLIRAPRATFAQ